MRLLPTDQKNGEEIDSATDNHNSIDDFRAEGRKKMLELADFYGFSVHIKIKTAHPAVFQKKLKREDLSSGLGEPSESIEPDSPKPKVKKVRLVLIFW